MNEIQAVIESILNAKQTIPAQYSQVQLALTEALGACEKAKALYPQLPKR